MHSFPYSALRPGSIRAAVSAIGCRARWLQRLAPACLSLGLAACATPDANPPVVQASTAPVPEVPAGSCAVEYKALLDLAMLARQYGASAVVFLPAIGDLADQLDSCLSDTGADNWISDQQKIGAPKASGRTHVLPIRLRQPGSAGEGR